MNFTVFDENSYPVNGFDIVINTTLSLVLTTVLGLIFAYLHGVSLAKQCLLLQLYKEFVILLVLGLCLINGLYIGVYTYGFPMSWIPVTIITLSMRMASIVLLLLANIIHYLKYRMNKEKMLDPPMPWGDNEQNGMIWIRLFCWGVSIGFVITMYVCGLHTVTYHLLTGQSYDESILIIHSSLDIFLLTTCAFFFVGERFYQKNNDGQAFDPLVTRQVKYLVLAILIAPLFSGIFNIFMGAPMSRHLKIWIRRKTAAIMVLIEIVIATSIILKTDQIRSCALKTMKNIYDEAFFLNIYLVPLFLFIIIHGCLFIVYKMLGI